MLKILKTHISPIISSLINDSFLCGIFPSKLKWAKVIPVFKKGSRQDKDNYRLISVLSTFSKIFEKAVFKRLYGYLESRNILYPLQFGFRLKCSTNHALIQITESIRNSIDNNKFGCGIFNYLKKSFDTVNHCILLSKLNHYGVRGKAYDWFQSYLSNREQFVCINGQNSDSLSITRGVPEGSILLRSLSYTGPKLWNSLSIEVKKIKPFSSFRQCIKNSVIDGCNTIIDSQCFTIILSLTTI